MLTNLGNHDLQKIEELFLLAVDHRVCSLSGKSAKAQIKNMTARLKGANLLADDSLIAYFEDLITDPEVENLARRKSVCRVVNAAYGIGTQLAGNGASLEMYLV
ncbi:hypothetical protein [Pseudomonas sp. CMR5c]|uniref:hypothetical protein n=1 Tax=Pseudomonas TaxID=286 RepID=UPI000F58BC46|nr:hypothetical protein [Pseudomonas sp. CMR5c]